MMMISDFNNTIQNILKTKKQIEKSNSLVSIWSSWYQGSVSRFHTYYIYNGKKKIKQHKLSLGMAKKVCEDWASLLMNEKTQIIVKDQDTLDSVLMDLDFYSKANQAVEYGFALSMSALVLDVDYLVVNEDGSFDTSDKEKTKLRLDLFGATHIIPITYENKELVECAFVTENTDTTEFKIHKLNEKGFYDIITVSINNQTNVIEDDTKVFHTNSRTPWYVIIKPNLINNIELDSPYPISVFANAIDTLKSIDNIYDSYNNEFVLGRKRIFVSSKLFTVDKTTGQVERTFDPNDAVMYVLPESVSEGGEPQPLIKSVSEELRAEAHKAAMQDQLNILAAKTGLGTGYYKFEKSGITTATQVISENSDTFRSVKKHEILIEKALDSFTRTLMNAFNEFTDINFTDTDEVTIRFDDSIIEDKEAQKMSDRQDVINGVLSKREYRIKYYGEDDDNAKLAIEQYFGDQDFVNRVTAYLPLLNSKVMSVELFVDLAYTDEFIKEHNLDKQKIIENISESLQQDSATSYEEIEKASGFYDKNLGDSFDEEDEPTE